MDTKEHLNESTIASNEPTITGSRYDEEKAIDIEDASVNPAPEAPTAPNNPPRATGVRFALIFVGYVPYDDLLRFRSRNDLTKCFFLLV